MIQALMGPILGIADKVLDRVIPDKEAREKAKLEFAKQAATLDHQEVKEFHDFVVAYEGQGDKVHPVIQIYRGSVRPTITYALAGAYIYGFLTPNVFTPEIMAGLFNLNLLTLAFWFGNKTLKDLGFDFNKRQAKENGKT